MSLGGALTLPSPSRSASTLSICVAGRYQERCFCLDLRPDKRCCMLHGSLFFEQVRWPPSHYRTASIGLGRNTAHSPKGVYKAWQHIRREIGLFPVQFPDGLSR